MTEAYPLHWPDGWPRTSWDDRRWSMAGGRRHSQSWSVVVDRLLGELHRIGGEAAIISTNQPLRRDGLPYAPKGRIEDPGAAVYFTRDGRQYVMAQDRYELIQDNLRSLALAIEGLRQMERHGGAQMMERAFAGFEALPAPGSHNWRHILGSDLENVGQVERRFRELARERHPDHGGSESMMADLNAARDAAKLELS